MSALVDVRELLGELEEQPLAVRQVVGAILRELTRAQAGVAEVREFMRGFYREFKNFSEEVDALKEELAALKEDWCEWRSATGSLEFKLDNLAEDFGDLVGDFGDLVGGLREQGLVPQVPEFEAAKKQGAEMAGKEGCDDE